MSEEKKSNSLKVTTPPFRVSFPNVFKPKSNFEGQDPAFSIQMLFPKSKEADLKAMKDAAAKAAENKWGPDRKKWPKFKHPIFKDGDEKDLDNYKGMIIVDARSKQKPGLVDKDLQEIINPSDFYPGCWARATVSPFAYDKAGNKGISFGLQNIQKIKDDTAFSGKKNAKDDFDTIDFGDEGSDSFDESGFDDGSSNENDF